ncbi:hypothetical protein [Flavobacterium anhuiense]|uniref:hypothetical protein n=1 Tax=Flavobacterium anhuiense TaxID=459526 RepID=UPI000E6B8823|nr:hypothetical protein [Flavobacterium anhuiense]
METINYLKLQAKNLYKDFKTQKTYFDSSFGGDYFGYTPKYFDVDALVTDYNINEKKFTLMNAQHIIAKLAGFDKWTELSDSSESALELGKLLFDNMHKIRPEDWHFYILDIENANDILLDDEDKLGIFIQVFADVEGHQSYGYDYRLSSNEEFANEEPKVKKVKKKSLKQITVLPLKGTVRSKFITIANSVFEDDLERLEVRQPDAVRKLWNAEKYIDEILLKPDMLPIDQDYALSLVSAFLVHHVISLADETEEDDLNAS